MSTCKAHSNKYIWIFVILLPYKDYVTNEEVRAKIQQAIGPHEDSLSVAKRRKLKWYGHVSRSSGLAQTVLEGTMKWGRRQGRQKRGGKTTPGNGQAWSSPSPRGQWRTEKHGGNWLWSHLWCTNDPRGLVRVRIWLHAIHLQPGFLSFWLLPSQTSSTEVPFSQFLFKLETMCDINDESDLY